jgi:hypothetical protein
MEPENGIFEIYIKHRIENKSLYQMHFLVCDKKFRGGIFYKFLKKIPAEVPELGLLVTANLDQKCERKFSYLRQLHLHF